MKKKSRKAYLAPYAEILELSQEYQFLTSDTGGETPEIPIIDD